MNVVQINQYLATKGGVETYLLGLMPLLEARGVTTTWVFDQGDPALTRSHAVAVSGLGSVSFRAENGVRERLGAVLEELSPDVIHVHGVQNRAVLEACWLHAPTVLTAHDFRWICPAHTFFFRRTQKPCQRDRAGPGCVANTLMKHCMSLRPNFGPYQYRRSTWVISRSGRFEAVVAPSQAALDRLARAGFPLRRLEVLPYFCPLNPRQSPRPVPNVKTITFLGRASPGKGHEIFVEALGLLPNNVRGWMAGSFDEQSRKSLRELAVRHECEDRLTVESWASRERVVDLLDQTSVLVFPSLWPETLGIVGIEALSRGVPVVASDIGGVKEWLEDGVNGRLVPPGDAMAIARGVREFTATDALNLEAGAAGIATIQERFSPDRHVDNLLGVYERAVRIRGTAS